MVVSVVIPAYNAAAFIAEAVANARAQTLAPDEVIVVDDGSVDSTGDIASAAGARVIRQPNGGLSAARNAGIQAARSEWIALLDADDLWHPEKLERQFRALDVADDVDVASCDHYQFDADGVTSPSELAARRDRYGRVAPQPLATGASRLINMGVGLIDLGMLLFPSTLVLRRSAVLEVGGFDPRFQRVEDYEFLLRLLKRSDVVFVESPLMGYRRHAASLSSNDEAMALGIVALGDALRCQPERYAPGALRVFTPRLREAQLVAARCALQRGDRYSARKQLAAAGLIRRDRTWLKLSLASQLPVTWLAPLSAWRRRRAAGPNVVR